MKRHRISGDGNCLYGSCSFHLRQCHRCLRKKVSKLINTKSNIKISGTSISDWIKWSGHGKNYGNEMSKNGEWGSAIELSVICLIYNRAIKVYKILEVTKGDKKKKYYTQMAEFFPEKGNPIRILWTGSHYDALKKRE